MSSSNDQRCWSLRFNTRRTLPGLRWCHSRSPLAACQSSPVIRCIFCTHLVQRTTRKVCRDRLEDTWLVWCIRWERCTVWSRTMSGGQPPIWAGWLGIRISAMDRCCSEVRVFCMKASQKELRIRDSISGNYRKHLSRALYLYSMLYVRNQYIVSSTSIVWPPFSQCPPFSGSSVVSIRRSSSVASTRRNRCAQFSLLANIAIRKRFAGRRASLRCPFWIIGGRRKRDPVWRPPRWVTVALRFRRRSPRDCRSSVTIVSKLISTINAF